MRVSVIFTTYNSVAWLQKVLWGYAAQTHRDFEIVVADDGSGPETARCIEAARQALGLQIKHVWQDDDGRRKGRILNKAILRAGCDYLVFTEGDCIPRADFLAVHVDRAKRGHYLSGGSCKLPALTSERIARDDVREQRCFDYRWLTHHGMSSGHRDLKLRGGRRLAPLLNIVAPVHRRLKGCNASAWKSDVLAVNGFDERMQWAGLDRELGVRLENYGLRVQSVRYDAILLRLASGRESSDPQLVAFNRALRENVANEGIVRTKYGISLLRAPGVGRTLERAE